MHHYLGSGLANVWLRNGYRKQKTPFGVAVSLDDVAGLHRAIGLSLARQLRLSGREFRFLRKELGITQQALADALGYADAQALAKWERSARVPHAPGLILRQLYLESAERRHTKLGKLLAVLQATSDAPVPAKLVFEERPRKGWVREAV
ncbi:helix-turn-helix domain-containing protein [Silanimonas sp.]|uniref:helix-turn-helix domain-containing protein n=1 Tax=Silanimonas sp. TaxID=1929290 RepID=UPI001BC094C1|nr:helix-turn-helix domain-containing protein [Silanimonas sp.]MBS3896760.1 hypothetical protein [Silanimonas sp.]MBS3924652.1 hypothetical protein [Xanthomonadaceae bacterium]MBS3924968.1 hypothetical protein [Xanthomonadaceae bacterium]